MRSGRGNRRKPGLSWVSALLTRHRNEDSPQAGPPHSQGVGTPKAPRTWLSPGPALVPVATVCVPVPLPTLLEREAERGTQRTQPCAPPLTSASLAGLRGRSQGPRGFLTGSPRPAASSTASSSSTPRRRALPGSRRIVSLRGRTTRRFPASRLAPASLLAPGLSSSRGGCAGAAAQAWRRGRAGRGRPSRRGDAQGGGARYYWGSAPGVFPGLPEGWPLGASFALTPSQPSVPTAVA